LVARLSFSLCVYSGSLKISLRAAEVLRSDKKIKRIVAAIIRRPFGHLKIAVLGRRLHFFYLHPGGKQNKTIKI